MSHLQVGLGVLPRAAFGAAATSVPRPSVVSAARSTSAVSAMKGCLRSKVHVASQWLAELAAVSHTGQTSGRGHRLEAYLATLCSAT